MFQVGDIVEVTLTEDSLVGEKQLVNIKDEVRNIPLKGRVVHISMIYKGRIGVEFDIQLYSSNYRFPDAGIVGMFNSYGKSKKKGFNAYVFLKHAKLAASTSLMASPSVPQVGFNVHRPGLHVGSLDYIMGVDPVLMGDFKIQPLVFTDHQNHLAKEIVPEPFDEILSMRRIHELIKPLTLHKALRLDPYNPFDRDQTKEERNAMKSIMFAERYKSHNYRTQIDFYNEVMNTAKYYGNPLLTKSRRTGESYMQQLLAQGMINPPHFVIPSIPSIAYGDEEILLCL